jgi:hypothetical protein
MGLSTININTFNLLTEELETLEIKESSQKDNCLIRNKTTGKLYTSFILDENSKTKIICDLTFHRSSVTQKYLPRLTFKKTFLNFEEQETDGKKPTIISFKDSAQSLIFWKLIGFLSSFMDLVDIGEFNQSFKIVPKKAYFIEFETKTDKEKVQELKELILNSNIKENDIKSIVFENRKNIIKVFLYLLKNKDYNSNLSSIDHYRQKHNISGGEEAIWHYFLKNNDWILGLNVDIKFIQDFYNEQKVGLENSNGSGSPKSDLIGISDYTTLIELKHPNTEIFKKIKTSKSRANTWDFSNDFIEGISQCLGQKFAFDKTFAAKEFINSSDERLDKNKTKTIDPKTIFIIGNRRKEFPHDKINDNYIKSETFELFRRNNRNIDIITYDELFERAYHIIFSEKVKENWFQDDNFNIPS